VAGFFYFVKKIMSHKPRLSRAVVLPFSLLLFVAVAAGNGQDVPRFRIQETRAREYFKKGLSYFNSMKYVAAREYFYKGLDIYPNFHLARRYLGDAYYYSGEWDGALEQWDFLNELSGNAYPLVQLRSNLLRFQLNRYYDRGEYVFLRSYDARSLGGNHFGRPADLLIDSDGILNILSFGTKNVLRISSGGSIEANWKGFAFINDFNGPLAFGRNRGEIYVCDYSSDSIVVLDEKGYAMRRFGETGSEPGKFRGPSGVAVTENALFVSDSGNRRIQKLDHEGKPILVFGADGRGELPQFPAGIALSPDGTLWVADRDGKRILKYDQDGNFIEEMRSRFLAMPRSVEYGKENLFVADEKNGVLLYNYLQNDWKKLDTLRDANNKPLRFHHPFAVREDSSGTLYVANYGNNRIDVISQRGIVTSNLSLKIQRIDTAPYPQIALFVSVNDRLNEPIHGLGNHDFLVYENDRRIGVIRSNNIVPYNNRTSIVFVKENSVEMKRQGEERVADMIRPVLSTIRTNDTIRVIRIGEQVREVYEGLHRLEIIKNIAGGDSVASPNIGKGLFEGITALLPDLGPRSVVLVVSGKRYPHAFNQYSLQRIIGYAKANHIIIHTISFESETDEDYKREEIEKYRNLAESTGGSYLRAQDETSIKKLYDTIRDRKDDRYLITYRTATDRNIRGRFIDVKVKATHAGTTGIGDGGYFVPEKR